MTSLEPGGPRPDFDEYPLVSGLLPNPSPLIYQKSYYAPVPWTAKGTVGSLSDAKGVVSKEVVYKAEKEKKPPKKVGHRFFLISLIRHMRFRNIVNVVCIWNVALY